MRCDEEEMEDKEQRNDNKQDIGDIEMIDIVLKDESIEKDEDEQDRIMDLMIENGVCSIGEIIINVSLNIQNTTIRD